MTPNASHQRQCFKVLDTLKDFLIKESFQQREHTPVWHLNSKTPKETSSWILPVFSWSITVFTDSSCALMDQAEGHATTQYQHVIYSQRTPCGFMSYLSINTRGETSPFSIFTQKYKKSCKVPKNMDDWVAITSATKLLLISKNPKNFVISSWIWHGHKYSD